MNVGYKQMCTRIENIGNKAVYDVVFDVLYNGKSLRKAGVNLSSFFQRQKLISQFRKQIVKNMDACSGTLQKARLLK